MKKLDKRIKVGTRVLLINDEWDTVTEINDTRVNFACETWKGAFQYGHVLKFTNKQHTEKKKRHFYVAVNRFGLNLSFESIGWEVLRFDSKKERNQYLEENGHDGNQYVAMTLKAKNLYKIFGIDFCGRRAEPITWVPIESYHCGQKPLFD